jgi:ketosteroid isomerase-like protein
MADNCAIVRELYAAFGRGDIPAVMQALAPDIRWTEAEGFPYGGTYTGPEAVLRNVIMRLATEWQPFAVSPEEFVADGDMVVSLGLYRGVYKATGKGFTAPFAHVWNVRNGKVVRFRQHTDTALVQQVLR